MKLHIASIVLRSVPGLSITLCGREVVNSRTSPVPADATCLKCRRYLPQ